MIKVSKIKNQYGKVVGFTCDGHAEYAKKGEPDIVCAAVSALVYTTINSIETLTDDVFHADIKEDNGFVEFIISSDVSPESETLMNALFIGLEGIKRQYGKKYVTIQ